MSKMNLFNIILKSIESCETSEDEDFNKSDLTDEIFKNEYSGVYYKFINMLRENGYIKESEETTKYIPKYKASISSLIRLLSDIKKWNISQRYTLSVNKLYEIIEELKKKHKAYNFNNDNFKYESSKNSEFYKLQKEGKKLNDKLTILEDIIIETNETIKLKINEIVKDELIKVVKGGLINDYINESVEQHYDKFNKKVDKSIKDNINRFNEWNKENKDFIKEYVESKYLKVYKKFEKVDFNKSKVNDLMNDYIKNNINSLILSNIDESDPKEILNGIYENILKNNKMLLSTNENFKKNLIKLTDKTIEEINKREEYFKKSEESKDELINELIKENVLIVCHDKYELKKIQFKKYYNIQNDKFVESLKKLNIENKTKLRLYKNEIMDLIKLINC
jgi:hypothetical protein